MQDGFFLLGPHIFEAKVNKEKNFSTGTIARARLTLQSLMARQNVRTIKVPTFLEKFSRWHRRRNQEKDRKV